MKRNETGQEHGRLRKAPAGESGHASSALENVPLVKLMCLVFTCMPVESDCRQLGSLLLCLHQWRNRILSYFDSFCQMMRPW